MTIKRKIIIALSCFGLLCFTSILFPSIRMFFILLMENFILQRQLEDPGKWHREMLFWSSFGIIISSILLCCSTVFWNYINDTILKKRKLIGNNKKEVIFNSIYFLYTFYLFFRLVRMFSSTYSYTNWGISEFLINYQGGFVRRGLTGEILLFFAKNFNINIELTIKILSLVCFLIVCFFFVKSFHKNKYSLYILPLCFFLGGGIITDAWVRKDYMLICFLILILYLYKSALHITVKFLFINILAIFIILSHEVFAFFSLPILFLFIFFDFKKHSSIKSFVLSFLYLIPSIFAFLLTLRMHGDQQIAQMIWSSWTSFLDVDFSYMGAVEAIGWSKKFAIDFVTWGSFLIIDNNIAGLIIWIITFPLVYYIASNAILVFRKNGNVFTDRHHIALSSLLIFQFICLIPVFLIGWDYLRFIFMWIASSFTIFLLIPINKIENIFPKIFINYVNHINRFLSSFLRPSKTNMVLLMLFIGISPYSFSIQMAFNTTMLYNLMALISKPIIFIIPILNSIFGR